MLQLDASKRPSLREVVNHPWLVQYTGPALPTPTAAQAKAAKAGEGAVTAAPAGGIPPTPTAATTTVTSGGIAMPAVAPTATLAPTPAPTSVAPEAAAAAANTTTTAAAMMRAGGCPMSPRRGEGKSKKVQAVAPVTAVPSSASPSIPSAAAASSTTTGTAAPAPTLKRVLTVQRLVVTPSTAACDGSSGASS